MNVFHAAILGLVQGFAEFLPISSSGHLVLVQEWLGITQGVVFFDIFVHFATLLSVLIYFRKEIFAIKRKELLTIMIASAPVGIVGLLFEDRIAEVFGSVFLVGIFLIISGVLNFITEYQLKKQVVAQQNIGLKEALFIGLFQAFAILPGVSRSGATISAGLIQNLDRKVAFHFSFLMVIPVILGANMVQLLKVMQGEPLSITPAPLIVGGLIAFISGLLNLKLFEYVVAKARMNVFGWYCIIVGLSVVFYSSVILN